MREDWKEKFKKEFSVDGIGMTLLVSENPFSQLRDFIQSQIQQREDEIVEMIRKGWKTFDGMVKVLEELNEKYKKYNAKGNFTIQLPLKRYRRK